MLKILFLIVAVGFSFDSLKADAPDYPSVSQADMSNFEKQLEQAIKNAEKAVEAAKYSATRRDIAPTSVSKIELQNAIVQLDVKKTLVSNFRGSESIQSPLVRRKLIEVLNKSLIMPSDLADLQSLVLEEKAKIRAQKAQNQTTPPATTTLIPPPSNELPTLTPAPASSNGQQ